VGTVRLDDELLLRLAEFRRIVSAVVEAETDVETCVALVLTRGLDFMLAELLRPELSEALRSDVVLQSFQRLAALYPEEVYGFVIQAMKAGQVSRPSLGFGLPDKGLSD